VQTGADDEGLFELIFPCGWWIFERKGMDNPYIQKSGKLG
jgi:hypothetical protein